MFIFNYFILKVFTKEKSKCIIKAVVKVTKWTTDIFTCPFAVDGRNLMFPFYQCKKTKIGEL